MIIKEITNGNINAYINYRKQVEFYLPHSCDEWVIGDLEDAKHFLEDLKRTIEQVEKGELLANQSNKKGE